MDFARSVTTSARSWRTRAFSSTRITSTWGFRARYAILRTGWEARMRMCRVSDWSISISAWLRRTELHPFPITAWRTPAPLRATGRHTKRHINLGNPARLEPRGCLLDPDRRPLGSGELSEEVLCPGLRQKRDTYGLRCLSRTEGHCLRGCEIVHAGDASSICR